MGSTRRSARPVGSRLVARLFAGWPEAKVDFLWCFSAKSLMRTEAIVPGSVEGNLRLHVFETKGDKDSSCVLVLQRENRSLDKSDASVFANGSISGPNLHATAPVLEGLAKKYRMFVGDDVLRGMAGRAKNSSQESLELRGEGRFWKDADSDDMP